MIRFQNTYVLKTVGLCPDLVFLFDEIRRIVYRVDHLLVFLANPGSEIGWSFSHLDYAGTVAQVVVHRVATGVTAVGKQDAFPENSIVVIMIVSDKYT